MTNYNGVPIIEKKDIRLPDRSEVTNKGDCGKLLVVGGDSGMAGAAFFAVESAYRMGVGLVKVLTHEDNRIPMQILIPEAIASFWNDDKLELDSFSAVAIGVGMGKSDRAKRLLYRVLSRSRVPTVIDADGLNILADAPELLELIGENTLLTPHIAEFSRLSGKTVSDIKNAPIDSAREFAQKYSTNIVLKDKISVIALADGTSLLNTTGDSTLSKGGSGDVLAGIIASLLAQKMPICEAVPTGVYIHGVNGEAVGKRLTQRAALARDIINALPETLSKF